jgi:hypothetical protein
MEANYTFREKIANGVFTSDISGDDESEIVLFLKTGKMTPIKKFITDGDVHKIYWRGGPEYDKKIISSIKNTFTTICYLYDFVFVFNNMGEKMRKQVEKIDFESRFIVNNIHKFSYIKDDAFKTKIFNKFDRVMKIQHYMWLGSRFTPYMLFTNCVLIELSCKMKYSHPSTTLIICPDIRNFLSNRLNNDILRLIAKKQ